MTLSTRQRTQMKKSFANKMSKIIHVGRFLGNMRGKLYKEALMKHPVLLAKDVLPKLETKATCSLIDI